MRRLMNLFAIIATVFFITSCSDENNPTGGENMDAIGTLEFKMTDTPIDNANIKSCVVTVANLKVDGQSVEGFNKTTVDILAYQNGQVFDAGDYEVEARNYSKLEFVLDHDMNANGKPGCYIEEQDGTIHALSENDIVVEIEENFEVEENGKKEVLLDFDLRKSIAANTSGSSEYRLATSEELKSAIRFTSTSNGKIRGNCNDMITGSDKIAVFAYTKGSFSQSSETQASGESNIRFRNAINSDMCDENGDFELHFMEEGEYELHFIAYDQQADGSLELKGMLEVNALSVLSPLSLEIIGNTSVEINVIATGLIEL